MSDGLTFRGGVPDKEQAKQWAKEIEREHSDYNRTEDTAANQIVGALKMCLGGFQLFICFDGEKPAGLLAYKIEDEPDRIELFNFAVLPAYQRRGIGVELLRQVQGIASGRRPIFASGINAPAFRPLERAGFWRVKGRFSGASYKWSDLPAHKNDDTPFAEEDEDE